MNDLLDLILCAHGGLDRWRQLKGIDASMSIVGGLWARKGWPEGLRDVRVTGRCHEQFLSYAPFTAAGRRSEYTPARVTVVADDGHLLASRDTPRAAFEGHTIASPWDELHLAYFSGYAMWNYLTTPFVFAEDGVQTREIEPWEEGTQTWRRLHVTFPDHIATHSREQVFHVDGRGLITRLEYTSAVTGAADITTAHCLADHREFCGIVVPTTRRAFRRGPDGTPQGDRPLVAIDIADVRFF